MTNPTLDRLNAHASIRKYKPIPVSEDLIETIISAAQRASTSSNLQSYSVVATTEPESLKILSEIWSSRTGYPNFSIKII